MPDYTKFLMRHGEYGIQDLVERIERYEGIRFNDNMTLEDRWNALMRSASLPLAA